MSSSKLCRKKLIFSEEETNHLPSYPPQSLSSINSTPKLPPPSCDPNPMLRIYLPRFAELFPIKPDVDHGDIDSSHPQEVNHEPFTSPTSKSLVPTISQPLTQLTPTSHLQSPPHVNPTSNMLYVRMHINSNNSDLCVTPKSNKLPILYFGSSNNLLHKLVFLTPSSFRTPTSNSLCPYCAIPDSICPNWNTYLKRSPVLETPPHLYCTTSEDEDID